MPENEDIVVTARRAAEPPPEPALTDRRIYELINDRLGTTGQECRSDESLLNGEITFCEIADRHLSGTRINPRNGNIEAEFTDREGRVTYMNGNQLLSEMQSVAARVRSDSDNLTVTSPQDTAWMDQIIQAGSAMSDLAQDSGLPFTWNRAQPLLSMQANTAPAAPVMTPASATPAGP